MSLAEYCRLMNEEFPDDVVLASAYLEAKGLKFCVDFGYLNAWQMAEELYAENGF